MVTGGYDDPLTREIVLTQAAGAAGTTKFALYAQVKLTRARAVVKAAGTSANTGAYIDILVGTATAGRLLTGSSTAGAVVDIDFTDTVVPAGTVVTLVNGTDATGSAVVSVEYAANT